jgi:hypothetical protein
MRLFANGHVPYLAISVALIGAWALASVAINGLSGELAQASAEGRLARLGFAELLQATLTVYLLTCEHVARRETARDLGQLRNELVQSEVDIDSLTQRAFRESRMLEALNMLGPRAIAIALVELDPAMWLDRDKPAFGSTLHVWSVVRNTLLGWAIARLAIADIRWTRTFVEAARHIAVPLPRGGLAEPFVRKGLRSVAISLVFSSLFSLFWLGESAASVNPVLFTVVLVFSTTMFYAPLAAFRTTVKQAKRRELEGVDREIEKERGPLLEGRSPDSARLGSLVAWRGLVDGVDEWPLTAPAAIRFGLFILLGLGSWLGGALVERGVDALMG